MSGRVLDVEVTETAEGSKAEERRDVMRLFESLIVILIVGVLATFAVPSVWTSLVYARSAVAGASVGMEARVTWAMEGQ